MCGGKTGLGLWRDRMLEVGGSPSVTEVTSRTRQLLLALSHAMLTDASQKFLPNFFSSPLHLNQEQRKMFITHLRYFLPLTLKKTPGRFFALFRGVGNAALGCATKCREWVAERIAAGDFISFDSTNSSIGTCCPQTNLAFSCCV